MRWPLEQTSQFRRRTDSCAIYPLLKRYELKSNAREAQTQIWPEIGRPSSSSVVNCPERSLGLSMPCCDAARQTSHSPRRKFVQAANWPDIVRDIEDDERRIYNKSRWHYINLVIWHTPEDEAELIGTLGHNMDTSFEPPMRRELNAVQALRGNLWLTEDNATFINLCRPCPSRWKENTMSTSCSIFWVI